LVPLALEVGIFFASLQQRVGLRLAPGLSEENYCVFLQ